MNSLMCILKKELKEVFRDKKSLSMMLIIPIFIPLLVFGMSALFESQVNKDVNEYNRIGFSYDLSAKEEALAKEMDIKVISGTEKELKEDYENGDIDLYVVKNKNEYVLNGDDNDTTSYALSLVNSYFSTYKEMLQRNYLASNNIDSDVLNIITVKENISEEENYFANYIINYAFLFLIMAITVSATYPATDTTAGEKERGTLETLLTFPIKSKDIIIGKFLSVTLSSIITGLISLLLMLGSLYLVNGMFKIYDGVNLMLSPMSILFTILVIIAYSFLISGLCIAIASKCKTFKEAQSALTPLTFISLFPGMIAFMVNIKSTILLSMIPFVNYTLIFDGIINGNADILQVILMFVSTIVIIGIVLGIIIKQYKSEKVLFSN